MATAEPARPVRQIEQNKFGRSVVYEGEVLRHSVHARVVHWAVALFFVLALLSGFALFIPWLYKPLAPLFGGGPTARLLHPWFGLGFVAVMLLQLRGWLADMRWIANDNRWLGHMPDYVTKSDSAEPSYVGKFNAGQKLWFWGMVGAGAVFLLTGVLMWFPEVFGRTGMWISYFFHDLAGLGMLAGFVIHIYEGTAAMPGTLRGMARGTVSEEWAWTHHPAWYREVRQRSGDSPGSKQR